MDFWEMTVDEALSGTTPSIAAQADSVLDQYASSVMDIAGEIPTALDNLPSRPVLGDDDQQQLLAVQEVDATSSQVDSKKLSKKTKKTKKGSAAADDGDNTMSLNKAYFDVKKMVISNVEGAEKEEAKVRLAMSLGAKPKKRKSVNYKHLKRERSEAKKEAKAAAAAAGQKRGVKSGKIGKRKASKMKKLKRGK